MGLFKRIFGSGTPESDKKASEDIEKVQSGAIHKLYPILKPNDWVGLRAGAYSRPLGNLGEGESVPVIIAYGYDAPSNYIFLTQEEVGDRSPEDIHLEAMQNLADIEIRMEHMKDIGMLTASGDSFSSEMILHGAFMRKAGEILGADQLLVSIARRTCIMMIPARSEKAAIDQFVHVHKYTYGDDSYGNAPISDKLFLVENGAITGIVNC